jgi:hypothetical protein
MKWTRVEAGEYCIVRQPNLLLLASYALIAWEGNIVEQARAESLRVLHHVDIVRFHRQRMFR